jgi:hypothetical protein
LWEMELSPTCWTPRPRIPPGFIEFGFNELNRRAGRTDEQLQVSEALRTL